jgi:Tol biopolymer transport system component
MDALEWRVVTGTEGSLVAPFLSPDGESIAYVDPAAGQLKRIGLSEGTTAMGADRGEWAFLPL